MNIAVNRPLRELQSRPVSDQDGAALAKLIAACFAEYEGCIYDPAEFPELLTPASHYCARGAAFWVMLDGEALVGSIAATPVAQHAACEISKFYLEASYRGGDAAKTLLNHAAASAEALGQPDLVLWTDTRFARAHRFYEKHGFMRRSVIRRLPDVSLSWEHRYERRAAP